MSWPQITDALITPGMPVSSRLMFRYRERDCHGFQVLSGCRASWTAVVNALTAQTEAWTSKYTVYLRLPPYMKGTSGVRIVYPIQLSMDIAPSPGTAPGIRPSFSARIQYVNGGTTYNGTSVPWVFGGSWYAAPLVSRGWSTIDVANADVNVSSNFAVSIVATYAIPRSVYRTGVTTNGYDFTLLAESPVNMCGYAAALPR